MKLYATVKNERGGKKSTGDDTRILVELSYKNKVVGTVGLYAILGTNLKGEDVSGYRVVWSDERGYNHEKNTIREEEITAQKINDKCGHPKCKHLDGICEEDIPR